MTRIQYTRAFLVALLSVVSLDCGQTMVPTGTPATMSATDQPATDGGIESQGSDDGTDAGAADDGGTDADTTDADEPSDGPTVTDDLCVRLCAVLLTTACPPNADACQASCLADLGGECAAEARADDACEAQLTATAFTCDTRGRIRLNPGNCDDDQTKFGDCLLNGAP